MNCVGDDDGGGEYGDYDGDKRTRRKGDGRKREGKWEGDNRTRERVWEGKIGKVEGFGKLQLL